jgi:FtsH-binding integral membrane protein
MFMYPKYNDSTVGAMSQTVSSVQARFIAKVYGWMCFALAVTAFVSLVVASTPALVQAVFGNPILFFGLIGGEFLLVIGISAMIDKMSAATATALFIAYAAVNGLTLSIIFLAYTAASVTSVFFITGGVFGAMSLYGYVTKKDLTTIGNLCFMALFGLFIAMIVNIFMDNSIMYWVISFAGVIIFVGLTAYHTQKIRQMAIHVEGDFESGRKGAIMGALALYLDFINLFIFLLRIFGSRR